MMSENISININSLKNEVVDTTPPSDKDIEGQYTELKGILKKNYIYNENEVNIQIMLIKLASFIIIFVFMVPIIISDLYFGFNNNSCVNEKFNGVIFTMKTYLLVSGFLEVLILLVIICIISLINKDIDINEKKILFMKCFRLFITISHFVWNILGGIVFWGTINIENICNTSISNYITISLILKFIGNLFVVIENFNKK